MSGETEKDVSGWTVDTVRAHFEGELKILRELLQERYNTQTKALEAAFDAQRTAMEAALAAQEKAVDKAEVANEKRFDSVNEFRAQLADQAASFMSRAESDAKHDGIAERIGQSQETTQRRLGAIEVALGTMTTGEVMTNVERRITELVPRRELNASLAAADAKMDTIMRNKDKEHDQLTEQLNANSLAIERVNAAGQTIYVLRGEAMQATKMLDDKILAAGELSADAFKQATAHIAELRAAIASADAKMMPRSESETRTMGNTERLREIEIRMQTYPTRDENVLALNAADAKFAAGIGTVTEKTNAIADRMAALDLRLSSRLDLSQGAGTGKQQFWGYAVAAISLLITVILFANAFLGK